MIKTIMFDFDGTLADTELIVLETVNKYADRFGYKKVNDHTKFREMEGIDVLKKELGIPLWKLPYIAYKAKQMAKKELGEANLFPKIKNVIDDLKKEFQVIIVTSNSKDLVKHVLDKEKVTLDFIHSSSFFTKEYRLLWIIKRFKLKKEECIYIGDEIRDVKTCKKVGIKIIGVSWGYNSPEALKKAGADFIAKNPDDIIKIVAQSFL